MGNPPLPAPGNNSRQVPRNTQVKLVPPVVTVILDHAVSDKDTFTLVPSAGSSTTVAATKATAIDATHSLLTLPIKDVKSGTLTYTLVQSRDGSSATQHTIFTRVPASLLLIDQVKTRPDPLKQKQYYTLVFSPPQSTDPDLMAPPADYSFLGKAGSQESGRNRALAKDSKALEAAYDSAIAVMSRKCQFVEWKFYGGGEEPSKWSPFGVIPDRSGSWQKIVGERWIYVYRRDYRTGMGAVWVDELKLTAEGDLLMTPMDGLVDRSTLKTRTGERPAPKAIGKTVSFPRRIQGVGYEYFFFAARFRLPARAVDELAPLVEKTLPPVNFEDSDGNVADYLSTGICLVPVLDPMTVALQLHDCYLVALDDAISYVSDHDEQSTAAQRETARRAKKIMLAQTILALTSPAADPNNQLHSKLNDGRPWLKRPTVEDFSKQYDEQVRFRSEWRDRWASLLRYWYNGPLLKLVETVYLKEKISEFDIWVDFTEVIFHRISESVDGRALVKSLIANAKHWTNRLILSRERDPADAFQAVRKSSAAAISILREFLPAYYERYGLKAVEKAVNDMGSKILKDQKDAVAHILKVKYKLPLPAGAPPLYHDQLKISVDSKFDRSMRFRQKANARVLTFGFAVEGINLYLAFKGLQDAYQSGSTTDKALAWVNTFGALVDFSGFVAEILSVNAVARAAVRVLAVISLVSAVIDIISGVASVVQEYKKGNMGGMVGSALVTVGSVIAAGVALKALITGSLSAGPWGLIALAIVALGYAIRLLFGSESDYHKLVGHCEWGLEAGEDSDKPDWSPVALKDLKGDYEAQTIACLNLLCTIKAYRTPKDLKAAVVKADWFPAGTRLSVVYYPRDTADKKEITELIILSPDGPVATNKLLEVKRNSDGEYVITRPKVAALAAMPSEMATVGDAAKKYSEVKVYMEVKYGSYSFRSPKTGHEWA